MGVSHRWSSLLASDQFSKPDNDPEILGIAYPHICQNVSCTNSHWRTFQWMLCYSSLWIFIVGVSILMCVCGYCGLLIYATYHNCDPITTKVSSHYCTQLWYIYKYLNITHTCIFYNLLKSNLFQLAREKDQLLPLLVMDVFGTIPGFPGIFVAGIFSASLRLVEYYWAVTQG